ncbi:STAS domain-containing protein [Streptomyces sp. 6-11-2]|uniref:STAS domain-containing protein n=1 Tax=Streptomyces sp. 6-11-2 TaxID=2585753 RepID=UPI00114502C4|nr:STAS domain-containing protein [Streptomyces sp. 6-11-2]GED83210.1 anti-sigma factor antagonist [Streptomyces sp. 6-11-2]
MTPEFHIRHRDENDWTIVEIHGEVDVYTVPRTREHLGKWIQAGRHRLIVDLTGTTFMDSTGLGLLVGIHKRIRARAGALKLVITNPNIRRIFNITSLNQVFPIYDSTEAALG